jgi:fructokinase
MKKPVVAGIGEILWDVFSSGKQLGGAPLNFAYHAMQAGAASFVISAVGDDKLGDEIHNNLADHGLSCRYLQKNEYPTSTVTVESDKDGHPDFIIHENVAWDHINWNRDMEILAGKLDAVCFGSLAQRSPATYHSIKSFLESMKTGCLKIFDINLRQNYYSKEIILNSLTVTDMLKLNEDELPILSRYLKLNGQEENQLEQILRCFDLKYVVYTMGSKGSIIISKEETSFAAAPPVRVVDTVGAGDVFTAIFTIGILQGSPQKESHEKAAQVAAYVCTQRGATPVLPEWVLKQL